MKKSSPWRLAAATIALASLVACAGGQATPAPNGSGQHESGQSDGVERTVTDMAGRKVAIAANVETVGTIGSVGVLNAFVQLMGSADKILNGLPGRFATDENWKMQTEFSPQVASGPLFEEADEVVIENILANTPDVTFVMRKETAEQLGNVGVPVVYLEWNDVEDVKTAVALVGDVLGAPDLAQDYLNYFDDKQMQVAALTADLSDEQKQRVIYGDPIQFRQPHVIAEWWIDQAGGVSMTADGRTDGTREYTMEHLLEWDPEVMIVSSRANIEEMAADSRYADLAAVKNGEIYIIPSVAHIWGNRTVEQPLTVLWTLHKLYPERLSQDELAQEIFDFYSHFFKYDLSDDQLEEIINRK